MRKLFLAFILSLSLMSCNCSGIKYSSEENLKTISDLHARLIMKDSIVVMYKDSLRECRGDNRQLHYWIETGK
jgi:hypothetical protein